MLKKDKTPLMGLRRQLGSDTKPITVERLAKAAGIPAATLRSVETGRRTFNDDLKNRMRKRGIQWSPKAKRWVFTFNEQLSLSLRLLDMFHGLRRGSDHFQDLDARALCLALIHLMQAVPAELYGSLTVDIRDALEQLKAGYGVSGADEVFRETMPRYELVGTPSGSSKLVKRYSGSSMPDPHRTLDLSAFQKSHVRLPEDEQELAVVTNPAA